MHFFLHLLNLSSMFSIGNSRDYTLIFLKTDYLDFLLNKNMLWVWFCLNIAPRTEERPVEPAVWSQWKLRSLSYLLNKRTIRLVSGAALLFSAPKQQWIQVIERMAVLADTDEFYEKIVSRVYFCWGIIKSYFKFLKVDFFFLYSCPMPAQVGLWAL